MALPLESVLFALLILVFNVLDSVTTRLCFRQYPDKELKGEANPIMRWLMLKNQWLSDAVKQVVVIGVVVVLVLARDLFALRIVSVMLGLVVLNNTTTVVSRAVIKREVPSPIKRLRLLLHLPDNFSYPLALAVIFGLSMMIYGLVWGL